ncbi:hypothetical protein HNY73_003495 [Argiope bruennichi]|uniref:Uncharacterized protein n=1 Tax=Argiope bruennichi TaxID=94029 RepID=A0A8T0FNQ5_ARGBR|nr:hypothetical protein HNY73_003495 [Argiope bruennichi]
MASQTIASSAVPLCRYRMQADDLLSPRSFQTLIRPSEYCTKNRDSSEKTTLCHSCIQLYSSVHQNSHLSPLSREAEVMVVVRTVHAAANVIAPYERILGVLQTCSFPDKWSVILLYGFEDLSPRFLVMGGRLRSFIPFISLSELSVVCFLVILSEFSVVCFLVSPSELGVICSLVSLSELSVVCFLVSLSELSDACFLVNLCELSVVCFLVSLSEFSVVCFLVRLSELSVVCLLVSLNSVFVS